MDLVAFLFCRLEDKEEEELSMGSAEVLIKGDVTKSTEPVNSLKTSPLK